MQMPNGGAQICALRSRHERTALLRPTLAPLAYTNSVRKNATTCDSSFANNGAKHRALVGQAGFDLSQIAIQCSCQCDRTRFNAQFHHLLYNWQYADR
jgi:hypothetical protein